MREANLKANNPPQLLDLLIVIPAYNEADYLPTTLSAVSSSLELVPRECSREVIVVDDLSNDGTADVALRFDARVTRGARVGIGAARNVGARLLASRTVVFLDADTVIEPGVLTAILDARNKGARFGAVVPVYESKQSLVRLLLNLWSWYAPRKNMTQGVCQFFDTRTFTALGGYDEALRMAEDTDMNLRARRMVGPDFELITQVHVYPSMRRYEQWHPVKSWIWTNPLTTRLFRQSSFFWRGWYARPPR